MENSRPVYISIPLPSFTIAQETLSNTEKLVPLRKLDELNSTGQRPNSFCAIVKPNNFLILNRQCHYR